MDPHTDETLARCARRAANRSQREVAAAVGIDRAALSRIERGIERPKQGVRARLALALDITPAQVTEAP